jgi:hypothetical protein
MGASSMDLAGSMGPGVLFEVMGVGKLCVKTGRPNRATSKVPDKVNAQMVERVIEAAMI